MVLGEHLLSMLTTHIDDIKGSATEAECKILLTAPKKDYGDDAKIEKTSFEDTGIHHVQEEAITTVYTPEPRRNRFLRFQLQSSTCRT